MNEAHPYYARFPNSESRMAAHKRLYREWTAMYREVYGPDMSMLVCIRLFTGLQYNPIKPKPALIHRLHERFKDGALVRRH